MRRSGVGVAASVGSLVDGPPLSCGPETTVGEAANRMAEGRVSAILVRRGRELGILTDHDLRTRVVARRLGSQVPVAAVATFPAQTVPPDASVSDAILLMLERGFHHLPVVRADGSVSGVIEETDLLERGPSTPFTLVARVDRARTPGEAVQAAHDLPDTIGDLVDARLDPVEVGHVIGMTFDALTRRLLDIAVADHGEPPVPWAWLALGSLARHEQALHSDQDHALAFDPADADPEAVDDSLEPIAAAVTDGLERAGMPRCRAGLVAEHRGLRRPIDSWAESFRGWMADDREEAVGVTAVVFDHRRVAGSLEVESVLAPVMRTAQTNRAFLGRLTSNAVADRPPIGLLRRFLVRRDEPHLGRLDLKAGGILPITALVRVWALSIGSSERRTLDRLRAARAAGGIDQDTQAGLDEAFRLLWRLRLEHQVARARAGLEPDDFVDPKELEPIARSGLREAFRVVARAQRDLSAEFSLGIARPTEASA